MSGKILLVEDEPAIADTIRYALETEGFQAIWAATAGAGLTAMRETTPDLAILDVGLPDMSGWDLCRTIRQSSDLPIIFLTARDSEIDRVLGLELGADDYVVKPFSPRELVARVRARLRRLQTPMTTKPQEFDLDEAGYRVLFQGRDLQLTRNEFRLFRVLARRPGQVFSRDQLLDMAWDERTVVTDRTVDTHIKTLRQKIRRCGPEMDPIRTVRGVGYAYED